MKNLKSNVWSFTEDGQTVTLILAFKSPDVTISQPLGGTTISINGTYTVSGSTVVIIVTIEGEPETMAGTLSGNKLTFDGVEFTKQ